MHTIVVRCVASAPRERRGLSGLTISLMICMCGRREKWLVVRGGEEQTEEGEK